MSTFDQLTETKEFLIRSGITVPEVAIILGTGLGGLKAEIDIDVELSYEEIPNFPRSTVEFHSGKLIYGRISGKNVLTMQGRFHFYEGHGFKDIGFPIWLFKMMGIETLLLSGAAGTINPDHQKGNIMVIEDHINLLPSNPLIGSNDDRLGTRFPDMSEAYNKQLVRGMMESADALDIRLHKGVYVAAQGPMLETAAEYRYLRNIGGDCVGMSTIPEVIVAQHTGLRCAAVVVLTDECDPNNLQPVSIPEILEVAASAEQDLIKLFKTFIQQLD